MGGVMNRSLLCGMAGLLLISAGCVFDRGPAPMIRLGEPIEDPADAGHFDAGWRVTLDLARLEALAPGESTAAFIADPEGRRFSFRLQGREDGPPAVWRGRLLAMDGSDIEGSVTLTRQNDRLAGRIRIGRDTYTLRAREADSGRLFRIDPEQLPQPGPAVVPEKDGGG